MDVSPRHVSWMQQRKGDRDCMETVRALRSQQVGSHSGMNAIAMSLWGALPMYLSGAVRNAELLPSIYPGWTLVVYADDSVPIDVKQKLVALGVEIRPPECVNKMFWRFFIADDPTVERFLIRDSDSRFNEREAGAVKEWIESGKKFHVLRDHPSHSPVIGGGLFGAVKGAIPSMAALIASDPKSARAGDRDDIYNTDQQFLAEHVWPLARNNVLQHDLCYHRQHLGAKPFPAKLGDWRFCGEVFDHEDTPDQFHWQMRLNHMTP